MKAHHNFARWLYRGGRPNRLAQILNRAWAGIGAAGLWPKRLVTLELPGRRSGRTVSFPLIVADYDGERYLVSMLGEEANWVRNVRAASGRAVLRHRGSETVNLEEVEPAARAEILRRYLSCAPGARPHIPVDRHAPIDAFEKIAPTIPVFRIRTDVQARAGSS